MNALLHSVHQVVPPNVSVSSGGGGGGSTNQVGQQQQNNPSAPPPDIMMQIQDQENRKRRMSSGTSGGGSAAVTSQMPSSSTPSTSWQPQIRPPPVTNILAQVWPLSKSTLSLFPDRKSLSQKTISFLYHFVEVMRMWKDVVH